METISEVVNGCSIGLTKEDIKKISEFAENNYVNFVKLFRILPLEIKVKLLTLFQSGRYPEFLEHYPYRIKVVDSGDRRFIRMHNEEAMPLNFWLGTEMPEKLFFKQLKKMIKMQLQEN